MPDLQLGTGVPSQAGAVGAAVVGLDPLNGHSASSEPLDYSDQDDNRGNGDFVVVHLGVSDAAEVGDDGWP